MFRTAPITYSGEHLPLFATGSNPEGSHATWRIAVCSWTCSRVRGQQWVSLHRGRLAPTRETLCWHCVWMLWAMLSQTRRGWWPNQSPSYWNGTGDYSSRPFDIGRRQMGFFLLIFHLDFCFGKVAYGDEWTHPSSGLRYSVQIGSIQTIYDSKVILLAQVKLEIFQAQLWDVERQHINLECTGRNQKVACHMHCQ